MMGSVGKKMNLLSLWQLRWKERGKGGKRERQVLSLVRLLVNPETIVVITTDMCHCHQAGRETRDAAEHPLTHGTRVPTKNYLAPNGGEGGEVERSW